MPNSTGTNPQIIHRVYTAEDFAGEIIRLGRCLHAHTVDPQRAARELYRLAGCVELLNHFEPVELRDLISANNITNVITRAMLAADAKTWMASRDIHKAIREDPELYTVPLHTLSGHVTSTLLALHKKGVLVRSNTQGADGWKYRMRAVPRTNTPDPVVAHLPPEKRIPRYRA